MKTVLEKSLSLESIFSEPSTVTLASLGLMAFFLPQILYIDFFKKNYILIRLFILLIGQCQEKKQLIIVP